MHVFGMYVSDMYIYERFYSFRVVILAKSSCWMGVQQVVHLMSTTATLLYVLWSYLCYFFSRWTGNYNPFVPFFWYCLLKRLTHTQQCNDELIVGIIINFKIRNSTLQILITPHTTKRWKIDHYSLPQKYIARICSNWICARRKEIKFADRVWPD